MPESRGGKYRTNFMTLNFPSKPENVAFARVAVASFATQLPFTLEEIDEIKVATSEAVSNCVIHGYPEKEGIVQVEAVIDEGIFKLTIKDSGVGIADLEAAREPSYSTDPERMGLGLVFMESFMDSLEIETALGSGTTVYMTKKPSLGAGSDTDLKGHELQ
ncbi:MAG: anti-sigma F factor [Firmicutes bacterium]|nr:anti-sigma F factor [Bacillota bacterium]